MSEAADPPVYLPVPAGELDLNRCRTPGCVNFAVQPQQRTGKGSRGIDDGYRRVNIAQGRWRNLGLHCLRCGEINTLLSNQAVAEELARFDARLATAGFDPACSRDGCASQGIRVTAGPARYQRFGTTAAGSPRWRCRSCGATVSAARHGGLRLRQPEKTEVVLQLLVNKMPMRRMVEVAGVAPKVLYERIGRLARQCRAFAEHHERRFLEMAYFKRLHVNVDRQDHSLNWGIALERRPIALRAVATAEIRTGYILAQHVNYDEEADPRALELLAREVGDPGLRPGYRRYARLWLPHETEGEDGGGTDAQLRIPPTGAIVHEQYTMAAHILSLKRWFDRADAGQFSLDQEPGLDRMCMLAFAERIKAGDIDACFIKIDKSLTVNQRKTAIAEAQLQLSEQRKLQPDVPDSEIIRKLMLRQWIVAKAAMPGLRARPWVAHPYPTMGEPRKSVQILTDDGQRPPEQIAAALARASLRAVDRYFMQVRRKINLLERPIYTSGSHFRAWYGYSAYSPRVVTEVLEIFRTIYNFHLAGDDGKTPAQRLGIVAEQVPLATICAFSPHA